MKCRVLSIIIPALLMSKLTNAHDIYHEGNELLSFYGTIDGTYSLLTQDFLPKDFSTLFFGLRGQGEVVNGISGYGQFEYHTLVNKTEDQGLKDTYLGLGFAGIKIGKYNTFDFGRNYGVMYDVAAWTDVLPRFGGDTYSSDNFLFSRGSNIATYRNKDLFGYLSGLDIALQYQFKNDSIPAVLRKGPDREVFKQNGEGWGLSARYDLGKGVRIGGAFFKSKHTYAQNADINSDEVPKISGTSKNAIGFMGGIKYEKDNIYLAAIYSHAIGATHFGHNSSDKVHNKSFLVATQSLEKNGLETAGSPWGDDNEITGYYICVPNQDYDDKDNKRSIGDDDDFFDINSHITDDCSTYGTLVKPDFGDTPIRTVDDLIRKKPGKTSSALAKPIDPNNDKRFNPNQKYSDPRPYNNDNNQEIQSDPLINNGYYGNNQGAGPQPPSNNEAIRPKVPCPYGFKSSTNNNDGRDRQIQNEINSSYTPRKPDPKDPDAEFRTVPPFYSFGYANSSDNLELVAQYQFDFGLRPSVAFVSSIGRITGYGREPLKKYISIGATYRFNKNVSAYVDYKVNLMRLSRFVYHIDAPTNNVVAFGLAYHF